MKDTLRICIEEKKTSYIPIWFMRQAGRYLPEFKEIRKKNINFIKLCLDPNLIAEITLQPLKRFDLDAAIIFSDILMIPYGLGQKVEFKKGFGPILGNINLNNIINAEPIDFVKKLQPIYKGIEKVKTNLKLQRILGKFDFNRNLYFMFFRTHLKKNKSLKTLQLAEMNIWSETFATLQGLAVPASLQRPLDTIQRAAQPALTR